MSRSIPLRTMRDIWREQRQRSKVGGLGRIGFGLAGPSKGEISTIYKGRTCKKPREWRYITKPFFKKIIKEPIIDVFKEAEEVQIIIDLGNFSKGELNFDLKDDKYLISGKHEDCEFYEEIPLPKDVDTKNMKEIFRNNILELAIPKKMKPGGKK